MVRKITMASVLIAAGLTMAGPAQAAAYFINGKWYYFSLDFEALIAKITGKDLKTFTYVDAEAKISGADTECANPQSYVVNPGVGPQGVAYGTSPFLTDANYLSKGDKTQGNIYTTTANVTQLVDLEDRLNPPADICHTSSGNGNWIPAFWQDGAPFSPYFGTLCNRQQAGGPAPTDPVCYKELAMFVTTTQIVEGTPTDYDILTYITGANKGKPVAECQYANFKPGTVKDYNLCPNWTFVYLPTAFKFKADIVNDPLDGTPKTYDTIYGSCVFANNVETGAKKYGEPYSINNPPVNGWAAYPPASYVCTEITDPTQY